MDSSLSEDFEHEAQQNYWTDEDVKEEAGMSEAAFKDEDGFLADCSVVMDDPDWDLSLGSGDVEFDERQRSNMDSTRMFKLRRDLDQLDHFCKQKELNVLKAREELKACRLHVTELEKQRDNLQNDIEKKKQAGNSAAVFRLRAQHKCVCAELQAEKELEAHLSMVLQEHELELCQVEVELGQYLGLRQEVEDEEKKFQALKQEKYNERLKREKNIAKGAKQKALRAKNEQEKALQEQAALDLKKQEQIRASQQKAVFFLKQTLKRMREKEEEREKIRKELMKKRREAAKSLKANIAASQEALRVRKLKDKACLEKQKEDENCQKRLLQEAGMDSKKLIHLHKAQENFYRKQEELMERQKARRMEIASKLRLEEEHKERLKKRQTLLKHPPARVTQSMVLKRREQRLSQNLLPLPTHSEEEIIQNRLSSLPASSPASSKSDISTSLDCMEKQGRRTRTGADLLIKKEGKEDQECLVQPEFSGLWNRKHTMKPDEDISLKSSLSRSIKTGPDKTLTSKTTKKTTSGKVRKGPPFASKPETVVFKDFDLEKTYKRKVVLTNISNVTNYCRLVGVSQNLTDFISVSFEPPGPMSAGMACELEAIFRPLINDDLDGEIQFQSAAGPFSVIIKCRTKRCEMVVDSSLIDFGTHVVGETISRVITLTNRGALGTRYSLAPLSTNSLQLHSLSQHSSTSKQEPVESRSVKEAALCHEEEIQAENSSCITQTELKSGTSLTSCDTSVGVEASGADALEQDKVTEVEQGHDHEITEISVGKVLEDEVGPFASVKLPIIFTPTIPGETKLDIKITFSQPNCEALVVSAYGVAECVPVWVTKPSMDLKICMYDRLYQDSIEVQSRASTALRLTFEVCKELKNHLDILPKTGYVQAKSNFRAQLKFLPRCSLPEDAKSFFDQDTGVLEVPLNIQVADQVKPVLFTVHAIVTTSDLTFDHTKVDFGHCTVFESVQTTVRLTNLSLLPQDFGFVGIPKFIDIQPNDGFGTLLPQQTLEIDLIFSAPKPGDYNFQITCKSGINRDFVLPCHAIGVRPVLELSNSLVQFGATAVGDRSIAVLHILNSHTSLNDFTGPMPRIGKGPVSPVGARFFTFTPPENSEITLTPTTGRVLPGERCLVQVTFSPFLSDAVIKAKAAQLLSQKEELQNQNEIQEEPKKVKGALNHNSSKLNEKTKKGSLSPKSESPLQALNPEDTKKDLNEYAAAKASLLQTFTETCKRYIIPCFISNGDITHQKETGEPLYSPYNTLYLELHCPSVRPMLMVISDSSETTINFNQVALGQKVLKNVTVQNICSEFVKLTSSLLDINGPFAVLNAMRGVRPGETHTLVLAFTPALSKKYREILEVSCSTMTLEFTLCGEGIQPLVTCAHEGPVLDFGYVLEKQSSSQVLTLQNSSDLLVQFRVLLDSLSLAKDKDTRLFPSFLSEYSTLCTTQGTQNYSGQSVFSVSPSEGIIAPGKVQDIAVMFQPDHESLHYRDALRIQLMNHQTVCNLELRGAARCHNMFVCGGDPLDLCSESLIHPNIYSADKTEHAEREKLPTPLLLTLRSVYREGQVTAAVRELEVGCIHSSQPQNKKNGEFLWENLTGLQQHGFSVDPTKGSVDAGHRRIITVTWTPPIGHMPNKVVQMCVPLILKGDETEVYSVTLLAYTSEHTHSYKS